MLIDLFSAIIGGIIGALLGVMSILLFALSPDKKP
jgi:gas vesicle protein